MVIAGRKIRSPTPLPGTTESTFLFFFCSFEQETVFFYFHKNMLFFNIFERMRDTFFRFAFIISLKFSNPQLFTSFTGGAVSCWPLFYSSLSCALPLSLSVFVFAARPSFYFDRMYVYVCVGAYDGRLCPEPRFGPIKPSDILSHPSIDFFGIIRHHTRHHIPSSSC